MTRNPTYPLEPLREHRDRRVASAKVQLAEAIRRREAAAHAKSIAEDECRASAACTRDLRSREMTRLDGGGVRAADLAGVGAWDRARAAESADLARSLANAERVLACAREEEAAAHADLARASAELEVVLKDKADFARGERRAAEIAETEMAEEAHAATRRP